jgi:hypothetical protein
MGIESVEDFTQWYALGNKLKAMVCLNKEKSIQEELDKVAHIARLRRNRASAVAIYERENKEYLASKKTEKKNAGTIKEAIVQIEEGATQGATQADVLTPEAIAELLVKALESQGATTQASTTATTQVKKKGK